jgi:TPR repeat protein
MFDKLKADVAFLRGDHATAAEMFREGAEEGEKIAAFNYGYCLLRGIGVRCDLALAKSFFVYARDLEGGEACYNLAVMYMHGEGVGRNYKKALEYMTMAAGRGCIEAQLYLGMAYTIGCIFEPDIIAISMIPTHTPEYRLDDSMLLGGYVPDMEADEEARYSVIEADARRAFEWFRRAAHHDPTNVGALVAKGQYLYAKCYIDGLGTEFNRGLGERLMLAAGKSGSAEAIGYLAENGIDPRMLLGDKGGRG